MDVDTWTGTRGCGRLNVDVDTWMWTRGCGVTTQSGLLGDAGSTNCGVYHGGWSGEVSPSQVMGVRGILPENILLHSCKSMHVETFSETNETDASPKLSNWRV